MILTDHEGEDGEEIVDDIDLGGILFCQLDVLCHFATGEMGWKQMARYQITHHIVWSIFYFYQVTSY